MKKLTIAATMTLLIIGCNQNAPVATVPCSEKITISTHFTELPLPQGTCPVKQATTGTTTSQQFTLPFIYKDAIEKTTAALKTADYTVQEEPETTIGTQKMWTATVQKNTTSQTLYTYTLSNQNPVSFTIEQDKTFLTIQEHTVGG